MDITNLKISSEEIKMAVVVEYWQSTCVYILRKDGNVISTDNLNGIYSITKGEDLTKEFLELFNTDIYKFSNEEYEQYEEKVQLFLNKTQKLNSLEGREDLKTFLNRLSDQETLLVVRHSNCL